MRGGCRGNADMRYPMGHVSLLAGSVETELAATGNDTIGNRAPQQLFGERRARSNSTTAFLVAGLRLIFLLPIQNMGKDGSARNVSCPGAKFWVY